MMRESGEDLKAVFDVLAELACRHVEAQEAYGNLFSSRSARVRVLALCSLSNQMPLSLLRDVLTRALADSSKKVRLAAALRCDILRLREMVPELERRATAESDSKVVGEMRFHATMIRDGFLVKEEEPDRPVLWVRTSRGWCQKAISRADVEGGRVPALVAELQADS